jgi:stage V sporulation protein R
MASHTLAPFPEELLAAKKQIRERARSYGLDFFPVIFEMCDYEQMNQIAAYGGFPQRYPHWQFGMEYERLRKQHHYGLGRIYEMVINNDPCYAYLQESNALVDQKLVIAHVYGHCDFFKNNAVVQPDQPQDDGRDGQPRHPRAQAHGEARAGRRRAVDGRLPSIEHLIDAHSMFLKRGPMEKPKEDQKREEPQVTKFKSKDYLDRWMNPRPRWKPRRKRTATKPSVSALHARASDARRAAIPARPRAAGRLAGRLPLDRARGELLLRAAGHDEGDERRWASFWHST